MVSDEEVDDFLSHFGVKGMQWGVRNTNKGKVGLTPDEEILAVYGGVMASIILANVGAKVYQHHTDSGIKDAKQTGNDAFKENPKLKGKKTVDQLHKQVVKPINPDYPAAGTKMNCRRATMAYEMRRRGFDVKATKSNYATGQTLRGLKKTSDINKKEKFESMWGQTRVSDPRTFSRMSADQKAQSVFDSLSRSYPPGARGEIGSSWIMGGGHSMAFEMVGRRPVIFDTQSGAVYRTSREYSTFTATVADTAHTRLDNRPINDDRVRRWITNVND